MKLRRIRVENILSFRDQAELELYGNISILVGPNGGGKTNLLDIVSRALRFHLIKSWVAKFATDGPLEDRRWGFLAHSNLRWDLDTHVDGKAGPQLVSLDIEVTNQDLINIGNIQAEADRSDDEVRKRFNGFDLQHTKAWDLGNIYVGKKFSYGIRDGQLLVSSPDSEHFRQYLTHFECYKKVLEELGIDSLSSPFLYLPVVRGIDGIHTSSQLSGYNQATAKEAFDLASSRTFTSASGLVVNRLAEIHRKLELGDQTEANFERQALVRSLRASLAIEGFTFNFTLRDPRHNQYVIDYFKHGIPFNVDRASSGEKELLSFIFAIYGLEIRDGIVLIDEPELHLHPRWQTRLLRLFENLANETGNQFVLATHSPTFVSPSTVSDVSRVYASDNTSRIVRLNNAALPDRKYLFNIINSQKNERLFFADKVILVEGISDRIIFEGIAKELQLSHSGFTFEIIDVGGKGFFKNYEKILAACKVPYAIIADLDYLLELDGSRLSPLFTADARAIKRQAIDNRSSKDARIFIGKLENAIRTGDSESLSSFWNYMTARHRQLRKKLTSNERKQLEAAIENQKAKSIYLLRRGDIEAYLPAGYQSKDLDNAIKLVTSGPFLPLLQKGCRKELERIMGAAVSP